jgi:hypothetical protein
LGVWAYLHYVVNEGLCVHQRETIRDNLRDGWEWDRSRYFVNFYHHPYHGYLYYNAGRANGLGFWGSSASAFGGSLMWEYMMEKYRPSINDLITTTLGGIVYGEVGYRFSALVRKTDHGLGRIGGRSSGLSSTRSAGSAGSSTAARTAIPGRERTWAASSTGSSS